MARPITIVGNWKMNQSIPEIKAFFAGLKQAQGSYSSQAWVAPQFIHIPLVQTLATECGIKVGSQNCAGHEKGAYTGEVSPVALKEMGVNFTIIGHSERRSLYKETDAELNEKVLLALKQGLTVIFCVGETLEQREKGQMKDVITHQMKEGLKNIPNGFERVLVAYEPVWAIGTGKTATPEQAEEVHDLIRNKLAGGLGFNPDQLIILYGGSVKPSNINQLLAQKDIDGALVGGASLKAADFVALCQGKKG
ncbi:MAG: triose-phosphate isomerase [Bacteriovoracaceae bacterium]|nr:triose-phosphate isomerase [Bacteriovoracaceae bacterium]